MPTTVKRRAGLLKQKKGELQPEFWAMMDHQRGIVADAECTKTLIVEGLHLKISLFPDPRKKRPR